MSFDAVATLNSTSDKLKSFFAPKTVKKVPRDVLPWNGVSSRFWTKMTIDPKRWDQLFPYRLVVFDVSNNRVVNSDSGDKKSAISASSKKSVSDSGVTIEFVPVATEWIFRLPITPEQLTITDQFAINTSATLRGVLEEHNGLKFKLIQASGTMGVWSHRSSVVTPPSDPSQQSVLQTLFAGTISAATGVASQISNVIKTATDGHPGVKPKRFDPKDETQNGGDKGTGYYHALALQQFLEQYVEAKKDPKNAAWRLVFDIPKQNQSFVVTPMQFQWIQNKQRAMEISYSMQLKAWRRIDINLASSAIVPPVQTISPTFLQKFLNTITEARKLTSNLYNLIGAVRSDVEMPLDVLRQTSLFIKELSGAIISAADLPFQIQKDYASAIKESLSNVADISSNNPNVRSAMAGISKSKNMSEGLSFSAVEGGQLGSEAASAQSIDPANNPLKNPAKNFELMDQADLNSLSLNHAQQTKVDQVIEDARTITVDDLKKFRAVIQELALQLSNNFGAGSSTYSQIYGTPTPTPRVTPMSDDEYEVLKALYDVIQGYDSLTATSNIDDAQRQTNMDYVAGLASDSEIQFNTSVSKIMAPVPFGLNVEQIAARYLGDPQRWLEIVTLNNLRAPYIDENGFQRDLLSNATGRQITISDVTEMFVGQRVVLKSATQNMVARKILNIDRLSDISYLITLDGEPNLDNFTVFDKAYLQAYLPGTTNSQQKIFIPSDLQSVTDQNILIPGSVSGVDLVGLSKVDWLLDEYGDLAINDYGDFRFSAGITNLTQALKIKFMSQKGKILLHPSFGMGVRVGTISSDINTQDLYNDISSMILEDQRFSGIDSLQVQLNGPTLSISLGVTIAGQNGIFPITFELGA